MADNVSIELQIAALRDEVRLQRAELEAMRARVTLLERGSNGHRAPDDAGLFLALAGAVGSEVFSAGEALEHPSVQVAANTTSVIAFGKRLGMLVGHTIGGLRLERVGRVARVAQYRVLEVIYTTSVVP